MAGEPILNTFTVTETDDQSDANLADAPNACDVAGDAGDQCTLRAAMEESNSTAGTDVIAFGIPGRGLHTIRPQTELPSLSDQVTIDGYTQPGASVNTAGLGEPINAVLRIQLNGEDAGDADGLVVGDGAGGSVVGGLVINRFGDSGIQLDDPATIRGNFIGTNDAGTRERGNNFGVYGVTAGGEVGGTLPADRNLLSGNHIEGITSNAGMTILGNYIGTERDGRSALANGFTGIHLFAFSLTPSTIGGPAGAANVIAFNGENGVAFSNPSAGTLITRNRIFSNGLLGIDLDGDGITANDPGDGDTGSNNRQNFPVLASARTARGGTTIKGTFNSTANGSFTLELFSNEVRERQGRKFIGAKSVTTDAGGDVDFIFRPDRKVAAGNLITATATASDNSTSEFSAPRRVKGP